MINDQDLMMPTSAAVTNILNINFDCLYAIFSSKCLTPLDLCPIGESHSSLKVVVDDVFAKWHSDYRVNVSQTEESERINTRIFRNFGSLISKLSISLNEQCRLKESRPLFDLMSEFCSDKLMSLELDRVKITEGQAINLSPFFGKLKKISLNQCHVHAGKTLFGNCESLVELNLWHKESNDFHLVLGNTFPKLEELKYWTDKVDSMGDSMWDDFFSRHKNLRGLGLLRRNEICHLLPMVADNCKQLVQLEVIGLGQEEDKDTVKLEQGLSSILTLEHLRTLHIYVYFRNMTKIIQRLEGLRSLECLGLVLIDFDSTIVPALSKIIKLRTLKLINCDRHMNLNAFAGLERLTELGIFSPEAVDFDPVYMISRLINLKTLYLDVKSFQMDKKMYLRIVDVLKRRPVKLPDALQISCETAEDFVADLQFDKILRTDSADPMKFF